MSQNDLARLDEVEMRLAFQDDHIDSLNREIANQQRDLETLRSAVKHLHEQLQALQRRLPDGDEEEGPPPHY